MRILVTGASGMLGATLATTLSSEHEVYGTGSSKIELPFDYKAFDLGEPSYQPLIEWSQPDLVIHCAALTQGNYCQNNSLEALLINGYAVKKLIDATCPRTKILYISTDAVFPSKLHLAKENDPTSPESVYGKSKELGEFFLLYSDRDFLILRTTIVGFNNFTTKQGFLEWIINSSKAKQKISLFDDVLFNPISIWDFVKEIQFLVGLSTYEKNILHVTGREFTTKYNFGINLLKELSLSSEYVEKGYIANFSDRAKRSNDQTLSTDLYQHLYQRKLPTLQETIKSISKKYYEINYNR